MDLLLASALGTGIACGIWGWVTFVTPLISFVGFAGTTTYFFRSVEDGYRKIPKCLIHNLTGIMYATLAIYIGNRFGNDYLDIFMTGFISFMMVYQGKIIPYLDYPPASFIGCFTTFAAGPSMLLIPSFIAGYAVAVGCDYIGRALE